MSDRNETISTRCPRCEFEGPSDEECPRCGIVFAKYRADGAIRAAPDRPIDGRRSGSPAIGSWLLLLLLVAAVAVWSESRSEPSPGDGFLLAPAAPTANASPPVTAGRTAAPTIAEPDPAPQERDRRPPVSGPVQRVARAAASVDEAAPRRPSHTYTLGYGWLEQAAGFERALRDGREQGRIVTLYVYTDWCPYCRQIERNVLDDPAVQDCLAYSVKVKVDPERGTAEKRITERFGVTGYPRLYFIDPRTGGYERASNASSTSSPLLADCRATIG